MIKRTPILGPIGEMPFYSRKCEGDSQVLREVVMQDCYGLDALSNKNFEPDAIIDIGANIGAFSKLALKFWPKATLHAYEPHPISFGLLMQNLRPGSERHICHLGAVTGRDLPNAFIQIAAEHATNAPQCWDLNRSLEKTFPDPVSQGFVECNVRHINEIQWPDPDDKLLVKIDAEHSEWYIIQGIAEERLKSIDVLLMEVHCDQMSAGLMDVTWAEFRDKILAHFDCPEIAERKTVDRDQFIATAIRKQ